MLISCSSYAMTFSQAQGIYNQLTKANHFLTPPPLVWRHTGEVNADYDGAFIAVNTGMLKYCKNQDELAMVLGHELGHYTARNKVLTSYQAEYGADKDGAVYAANAGFNRCKGALAIYRFHDPASSDHPASNDRYNKIKC